MDKCEYCGNGSILRDNRGNCIGCGAPRKAPDTMNVELDWKVLANQVENQNAWFPASTGYHPSSTMPFPFQTAGYMSSKIANIYTAQYIKYQGER